MSSYLPPTYYFNGIDFNNNYFLSTSSGLTTATADARYLIKVANDTATGTESFSNGVNVKGTLTITDGTTPNTLTNTSWSGNIQTQNTTQNLTYYLNMSDSSATGYGYPQKNASINANPSTGTINATNIVGTNYGLVSVSSSAYHALLFTPTFVSANSPIRLDFQSTGIRYQPSTGTLAVNYLNNYCPSLFDDFTATIGTSTNYGSSPYDWYQQTLGTAGTSNMFAGTYSAGLSAVGNRRLGLIQIQSASSVGSCVMVTSQSTIYQPSALQSITFGFIPLGNGTLASTGSDAGNIYQTFGLASGTSATGANANSIFWRLSSNSASIPTWTLVENNVVVSTLSGTNLVNGLTNKWCRATITFTNNGANYQGTFTNLTDNVSFSTAVLATTNPNFFYQMYMSSATDNATAKNIAFDYVSTQLNTQPIGLTNASTSSR